MMQMMQPDANEEQPRRAAAAWAQPQLQKHPSGESKTAVDAASAAAAATAAALLANYSFAAHAV